ncbi:EP-interacting inhibitor of differentiation 3 [Ditylenchus destructor]|uniref:Non-structural maintenance of chromosomes element 4 n=1 Tax=Ditylenchus destructor TaxID=166010 RepID=A0AAD4RBN1_9BILA|nr:EP-interacting inhibitor of differentiation 3 [Ditylenchus destructor]
MANTLSQSATNSRQLKKDGASLLKLSELIVYKLASLCEDKGLRLNSTRFAECLIDAVSQEMEIPEAKYFTLIGQHFGHLLRKAPKFNFVRPCVTFTRQQLVRPKKERFQREKVLIQEPKIIQGKTTAQSREDTKDENTFSKEVDEVRKQLIKEFKHSEDQATVGYYNFVLHPTSFGETIQNMFFVSFLLRDGHVRLIVDETTNLPVLKRMERDELEKITMANRSTLYMTQVVSKMTVSIWRGLTERLNITESMRFRNNNERANA